MAKIFLCRLYIKIDAKEINRNKKTCTFFLSKLKMTAHNCQRIKFIAKQHIFLEKL